jgi:hypothetical protein
MWFLTHHFHKRGSSYCHGDMTTVGIKSLTFRLLFNALTVIILTGVNQSVCLNLSNS